MAELEDMDPKTPSYNIYDHIKNLSSQKHFQDCVLAYISNAQEGLEEANTKSKENVKILKHKGNVEYRDGNYLKAIQLYNVSLVLSSGKEHATLYSNRAMCLIKMKKFREALSDLSLSIDSNYPEEQMYKVYFKKAMCYQGKQFEAEICHFKELCRENITKYCVGEQRETLLRDLSKLNSTVEDAPSPDPEIEPSVDSPNETLPGADACVELLYSEAKGRYVVAKEDLKCGQILFVEKPFAYIPQIYSKQRIFDEADNFTATCDFCGAQPLNAQKCSKCCLVFYCDDTCKNKAFKKYHQFECKGIEKNILNNMGLGFLAMRVLMEGFFYKFGMSEEDMNVLKSSKNITDAEHVIDFWEKLCGPDSQKENNLRSYLRFFNLVNHLDKKDELEKQEYALVCQVISMYLKENTDFFEQMSLLMPENFKELEMSLLINVLLMRHMAQLICNAQAIQYKNKFDYMHIVYAGTAVYPSMSMLNHACVPNIDIIFNKNVMVVRAKEDIKVGDEIFNCYDPNNMRGTEEDVLISQYHFKCECPLCSIQYMSLNVRDYKFPGFL